MSSIVFKLTPVFTDNFTPSANPLNPANWTTVDTFAALQAVSGVCECSVVFSNFCVDYYTGSAVGNNQYVSVTIGSLLQGFSNQIGLVIRTDHTFNTGQEFDLFNTSILGFNWIFNTQAGTQSGTLSSVVPGDVFTFIAIGTNFYCLQNGKLFFQSSDITANTSGAPSLLLCTGSTLLDATVTSFVTGTATATIIPDAVQNGEIHEVYDPIATATNVLNVNSNIKSPGTWTATGQCAPATIEQPDNKTGSNSVVIPNEGSNIVLGTVTENNQVQKTVNGRYDKNTVLNNPA